jgi:RIO kinase 1
MLIIRKMYHDCKLVHADLSEYNILYHQQQLWIIDVSQSVEHDHPAAFEFLRNDLKNVGDFFGSYGVRCLSLRRAFDFVTSIDIETDSGTNTLKRWLETPDTAETAEDNKPFALEEEAHAHKATEDSVFLKSFIPRNLGEVLNPEQEVERRGQGGEVDLRLGVVGAQRDHATSKDGVDEVSEEEEDSSEGDEEDSEKHLHAKTQRGHRHEDREARRVRYMLFIMEIAERALQERKKAVKEAARERRKTKVPKAEKKKRWKASREANANGRAR